MSDQEQSTPSTVGGDNTQVGNIVANRGAIAIGHGATVYQGLTIEEVQDLFDRWRKADQPTVWDGRNPYIGLNAFQENDAEFFFGRGSLVEELLRRLTQSNFISISGPSGSGKSSVARAGLFHALRTDKLARSNTWLLTAMQPQGNPVEQLAVAMARPTNSAAAEYYLRKEALTDPLALHQQVERLLSDDRRQRLVLLIDQFEEIFTQTKDEAVRTAFINLLTHTVLVAGSRMILIITLRSDFISHCTRYPDLLNLINTEFKLVGLMQQNDLAKAIALPALEVGAEIDPALVSRILDDMKGEPGALPLMSFALRDLFQAHKTRKGQRMALTLQAYLNRGGIEEMLERHAKRVFGGFSEEQQSLAKGIFSKLIEVGQGRFETRRTATFAELVPASTDREEVSNVISTLAQESVRLITITGVEKAKEIADADVATSTITIAHEKLIDVWPWLRSLVDENRELIRLQNQINEDAKAWQLAKTKQEAEELKKSEEQERYIAGFLYRGGRLAQVEEQLGNLRPNLDVLSQDFVDASIAQRMHEEQREEAERQRERRTANHLRLLSMGLGVALLIAGLITWWAIRQSNIATARALVTQARNTSDIRLAIVLAKEAESIASLKEASLLLTHDLFARTQLLNVTDATKLQGHSASVYDVAWSPDGHTLASASEDSTIKLWDAASGDTLQTLQGHSARVYSVAWSPDGHTLASASEDSTIRLWDIASGDTLQTLQGHSASVYDVAWSPDGHTLASASEDSTIKLWDAASGGTLQTLQGHSARVYSVAWSPNGRTLASASEDSTIRLWDAAGGNIRQTLQGNFLEVQNLAWSPDGRHLASAYEDSTVKLWDVESGEIYRTLQGHSFWAWSVAWSPDGKIIASSDNAGDIKLWDATSGEIIQTFREHSSVVRSVAWSPDGHTLASASSDYLNVDNTIKLWNVTEPLETLHGHSAVVWSVAWSPDGRTLASASYDRTVKLWNQIGSKTFKTFQNVFEEANIVTWNPDGHTLAAIIGTPLNDENTFELWNVKSGKTIKALRGHASGIWDIAWSPDGRILASASGSPFRNDNTIRMWDAKSGETYKILQGHTASVRSVAWSPDGRILASASYDKTIKLWDVATGELYQTLMGHSAGVNDVAWSPDGRILASASGDSTIRLWNVATGKLHHILRNHASGVLLLAWSTDGLTLASVEEYSDAINLWDVETGEMFKTLHGHNSSVTSIAWSPDSHTLASASYDKTVKLWPIPLIRLPCTVVQTNLSLDEWRQYRPLALYRPTCPDLPAAITPTIKEVFDSRNWSDLMLSIRGRLFLTSVSVMLMMLVLGMFWLLSWVVRKRLHWAPR